MDSYALGSLSLLSWYAAKRIAASRRSLVEQTFFHLALALVIVAAWKGIVVAYQYSQMGSGFWRVIYADSWVYQLINAFITYGAMLGGILAWQATLRAHEHERREAAVEIQAREAQLSTLRSHLEPHFVFNSLTAVLALIDTDPARARELVERLADVLRQGFERLKRPWIRLDQELKLVSDYLDVERIRFGDRLTVQVTAPVDCHGLPVPPMILQPLVENAIKHSISRNTGPGFVHVSATRANAASGGNEGAKPYLTLRVTDSGAGFDPATVEDESTGAGLSLTRRRLEALYGARGRLTFERGTKGFVAMIEIPVTGEMPSDS